MSQVGTLYVMPVSWAVHTDYIELYGYIYDGRTIYVRISHTPITILSSDTHNTRVIHGSVSQVDEYITTNPCGELASLWYSRNIEPYGWLSIRRFAPVSSHHSTAELNISVHAQDVDAVAEVDFPDIHRKSLFWGITTNEHGEIRMISVITPQNIGIAITTHDIVMTHPTVMKAHNERDIIVKFFAILNTTKPDYIISYAGDTHAIPSIVRRAAHHGISIPKLSKLTHYEPEVKAVEVASVSGESKLYELICIHGAEFIDLKAYYERFGDNNLSDAKLEDIVSNVLEIEKNSIDASSSISDVIDYHFIDVSVLYDLWMHSNIQDSILSLCNVFDVDIATLLRADYAHIIRCIAFSLDPRSVDIADISTLQKYLKSTAHGIYTDVFYYDYTDMYLSLMRDSGDTLAQDLADCLEDIAPGALIAAAFYSKYVPHDTLLPKLVGMLDGTHAIAVHPTTLYTHDILDISYDVRFVGELSAYVVIENGSMMLYPDGTLKLSGTAEICNPKFNLALSVIKDYLQNHRVQYVLASTALADLVMMHEDVAYVMSIRDKLSIKLRITELTETDTIDYAYYDTKIQNIIRELQSLKLYQEQ